MKSLLIAVTALALLGFLFGIILGYASYHFSLEDKEDPAIEKVDNFFPQSQCGQCGYPSCLSYAKAIVNMEEKKINLCNPGGESVMLQIAELLNIEPQPTETNLKKIKNQNRTLAFIDEVNCIGCTKCIQICPVDAIVGTAHFMHTVISDLCTGCTLCIVPCPTQCIKLQVDKDAANNSFIPNWDL